MSNSLVEAAPLTIPRPPATDRVYKDQVTNTTSPESSTTFAYQTIAGDLCFNVAATWSRNLVNHSLCVVVGNSSKDYFTCKIDLKAWQFWGKKGLKSFEAEGRRVDLFWDFRLAKFSNTPEPRSEYYIALVTGGKLVLLIGDLKDEAYKRTRARSSLEEGKARLLYKKENVYGKKMFYSRAMLDEEGQEHDIVIETSLSTPDDPEMWITIDGIEEIRIMNLNWRFRGNETVMVKDFPLEIFWDVHDWLFSKAGSGHGFFIFKQGSLESKAYNEDPYVRNEANQGENRHGLAEENQSTKEFCHFLYAWRTEQ